jgi:hypothetical protein
VRSRLTAVYELDKVTDRFAGISAKPSDELEPSTPSLPFSFRGGKRGHGRVISGTKGPRVEAIGRGVATRAFPRVNGLVFAPRSHGTLYV